MLIFANADAVSMTHIVEFFGLFGGGKRDAGLDDSGRTNAQLAILLCLARYNILSSREKSLYHLKHNYLIGENLMKITKEEK